MSATELLRLIARRVRERRLVFLNPTQFGAAGSSARAVRALARLTRGIVPGAIGGRHGAAIVRGRRPRPGIPSSEARARSNIGRRIRHSKEDDGLAAWLTLERATMFFH